MLYNHRIAVLFYITGSDIMFRRLLDRFNRFMYGRYGADSLYYTLLIVFLLLGFINTFLRSYILLVAADVLFIWALFRYFSKNIYQRREENRRFLDIIAKIKRFFKLNRDRIRDFKVCRYRKCRYCKSILRLPVRRGSHSVRCPRCQKSFKVHIWF